MKIAATDLAMQASHVAMTRRESSETLRAWRGERPDFAGTPSAVASLSTAARQAAIAAPPAPTFTPAEYGPQASCAIESACAATANDPMLALLRHMIELLTGEKPRLFDMQGFAAEVRQAETRAATVAPATPATAAGRAGWGLEYDAHHLLEEFEQTSFSVAGTIRTADGQEIGFRLDLQMTRHYREESSASIRTGDAVRKDPLVINFGGDAVRLAGHAGQRFRFDLDGDGRAESLPLFASGSGYLALDLDGNGRIDSGRELFGPATGQGFRELAAHDSDGNGWIDANDPVFERLRVWTPDATGGGSLRSLAELGIGALGLSHVATPFTLRGPGNSDLGMVKNTGIYLAGQGRAGSIQEIDLTV